MQGAHDRQEHVLLYCYPMTKTFGFDWLKNHRGVIMAKNDIMDKGLGFEAFDLTKNYLPHSTYTYSNF